MKRIILAVFVLISVNFAFAAEVNLKSLTSKNKLHEGFVGHIYDDQNDKLYLKINNLESEFIYQSSLPQGLGSNDIGLDRGQLSEVRLVEFNRVGNKVFLTQKNTRYRAVSNNPKEVQSVEEAFASAILWSFPIVETNRHWLLVDASEFILQDSHGVSRKLASRKQGSYKLDKSRSAIYLPRTKSFPDNTELEASVTFTGDKPGNFVQQAAVNPNVLSLRMHYSFIRLPKEGYKPRQFHPQSGYWSFDYQDYAQPINRPITQRFIGRHRLEKKNPDAKMSEAVEPIVYYLDPGAPEPVKTALITGAMWWNQAFESIGYKNAFQVKILPDDADPLDVRYNVIQWVHRATRGWSYGYGVTDPRNGEIIKGHVTLGSLRVRQDYLIAQGMLSRFEEMDDVNDSELMNLALARIRQLSAHEVGHTLGLAHNFAASSFNRASVMDYPHPLFEIDRSNNTVTADNAYAENIGRWDKSTIEYGYQYFAEENESKSLANIIQRNQQQSMFFISDPDSRNVGDAQIAASLWDNGENTIDELARVIKVRALALDKFGSASLQTGRPYSDLQEILMPVYYFHRYQATAAAKWIGGIDYQYKIKMDNNVEPSFKYASTEQQRKSLTTLLDTLHPDFLRLNKNISALVSPRAYGYSDSRESLQGETRKILDQNALASASIQHTYSLLLEPTRLARIYQQHTLDDSRLGLQELGSTLNKAVLTEANSSKDWLYQSASIELLVSNYLNLLHDASVSSQVKTAAFSWLTQQKKRLEKLSKKVKRSPRFFDFYQFQLARLNSISPKWLKKDQLIKLPKMPPGSPI
ncbi:MAG: zinc-dependent metalloprotease [Kangiellaceae bacterium]|nr:zinc-dependent metalloprotease [Kangiellaceae bacterium]